MPQEHTELCLEGCVHATAAHTQFCGQLWKPDCKAPKQPVTQPHLQHNKDKLT